jgi:hypothetical protein
VTRVGVVRYSQFGILDTSFNHQGYQFAPRINPRFPIVLKLDNEEDIFGMYAPRGERIYVYFFTNEGKWCKDFAIGNNYFHISGADLTIKPNGKFIITFAYTFKYSIYQYNNNGTRDSTFGFDGFESVSFTRGVNTNQDPYSRHWYTYLAGTSFMPNGDIIMAGDQYSDDGKFSLILTRLDSNGHRKLAFGQDGKYYLEFGNIAGSMQDMHVYENGDLLVCGIIGNEAFIFRFLQDLVLPIQSELLPSSPERPLIYPNPLSLQANLRLTLSHPQEVSIQLYNLEGRHIQSIHQGIHSAGEQDIRMEFQQGIAPGYYLVRVETEEGTSFIKVQIL